VSWSSTLWRHILSRPQTKVGSRMCWVHPCTDSLRRSPDFCSYASNNNDCCNIRSNSKHNETQQMVMWLETASVAPVLRGCRTGVGAGQGGSKRAGQGRLGPEENCFRAVVASLLCLVVFRPNFLFKWLRVNFVEPSVTAQSGT